MEDEVHMTSVCEALETERKMFQREVKEIVDLEKIKGIAYLHRILQPDMLKLTAKHIVTMLDRRRDILYVNTAE